MSRQRGWVSVSVQTYQSHRTSAQRILQQEYTVDESGATLNALSRSSENAEEEPEQQNSTTPTTSIFIRDWKVRRSRVHSCKFPPKLWRIQLILGRACRVAPHAAELPRTGSAVSTPAAYRQLSPAFAPPRTLCRWPQRVSTGADPGPSLRPNIVAGGGSMG